MKNSLKLFTLKGISVYLHWSFGLLVVLMFFVQSARGIAVNEAFWSVVSIAALFTCVVLHELGHALTAARYGIHTKSITLLPIGGIATMEKMPEKPIPEIIVSAAGPMVNLVIAAMLLPFISGYPPFWKAADIVGSVNSSNFLYYLHTVNIMLALFNLIPAFPMDGGRIFKGILELFMDNTRAIAVAAFTGRVIAAMFVAAGLVFFDIILMLIGFFIIVSSTGEEKMVYLKAAAKGMYLKDLVSKNYHSFPADMTMNDAAEQMLQCEDRHFLVTDHETVVGIIDRSTVLQAVSEGRHQEAISRFMTTELQKVDDNIPAEEVIDKLSGSKITVLAAVSNNRVTGMVNMQHIIEYLMVHDANLKKHNNTGAMHRFLHAR